MGELTGRWELIDGEVLSKMGQKPAHRFTLLRVAEWLASQFGFRRTQTQLPIRIPGAVGQINEPEPDVTVVTEQASAYFDRIPDTNDVLLVVEIADTSLAFDLGTKALLYARSGVPEYWVVDVTNRLLYRHKHPANDGYIDIEKIGEYDFVDVESGSRIAVLVGELLPPRAEA
jgi:Uma2 family endonuclease